MSGALTLTPLRGIPQVVPGDDLCAVILSALGETGETLQDGDILVVAQKIVSKAEGRIVDLKGVTPGPAARELAGVTGKDARLVELILSESRSVIRAKPGVIITEHRRGWIMANAGIDASNVAPEEGAENVLLLPLDPDLSAGALRDALIARSGARPGVIISDSFGRPWRLGTTGVALGAAGVVSLWDRRGDRDMFGRVLEVTQMAVADELATAASLVQGQADEGLPVVLVRGCDYATRVPARPASDLIRDVSEDMFR